MRRSVEFINARKLSWCCHTNIISGRSLQHYERPSSGAVNHGGHAHSRAAACLSPAHHRHAHVTSARFWFRNWSRRVLARRRVFARAVQARAARVLEDDGAHGARDRVGTGVRARVRAQLHVPRRRVRAAAAAERALAGVRAHVRRQLVLLGGAERAPLAVEGVLACGTRNSESLRKSESLLESAQK